MMRFFAWAVVALGSHIAGSFRKRSRLAAATVETGRRTRGPAGGARVSWHADFVSRCMAKEEKPTTSRRKRTESVRGFGTLPPLRELTSVKSTTESFDCALIVGYSSGQRFLVKSVNLANSFFKGMNPPPACRDSHDDVVWKQKFVQHLFTTVCVAAPPLVYVLKDGITEFQGRLKELSEQSDLTCTGCIDRHMENNRRQQDQYMFFEFIEDGTSLFPRLPRHMRVNIRNNMSYLTESTAEQLGRLLAVDFVVTQWDRLSYGAQYQVYPTCADECDRSHLNCAYYCGKADNIMYSPKDGAVVAIDNDMPKCLRSKRMADAGYPGTFETDASIYSENVKLLKNLRDITLENRRREHLGIANRTLSSVAQGFRGLFEQGHSFLVAGATTPYRMPTAYLYILEASFVEGLKLLSRNQKHSYQMFSQYAPPALSEAEHEPPEIHRMTRTISIATKMLTPLWSDKADKAPRSSLARRSGRGSARR